MRIVLSLVAVAVLAGCGSAVWPVTENALSVRVDGADLVLTNRGPGEIVEVTMLARLVPAANWAICSGGPMCIGRPPGTTWRRPLNQIRDYVAGDEIVIFWNHLVPLPNGERGLVKSGRSSIRP